MNTLETAYAGLVDAIIADPTLSRSDGAAVIEGFGPIMTGAESRTWIDAMATFYESLGIINNPTWSSFRNEVANEGKTIAEALFNSLIAGIGLLPETEPVSIAIRQEAIVQELALIDPNIATLQATKTGEPQLDAALDLGIAGLTNLRDELEHQLVP